MYGPRAVDQLPEIALRLLRVQFENRPAEEAIALYDTPGTLFYCDPPYVHATRGDSQAYGFEMTDAQHESLAALLGKLRGRVAVWPGQIGTSSVARRWPADNHQAIGRGVS